MTPARLFAETRDPATIQPLCCFAGVAADTVGFLLAALRTIEEVYRRQLRDEKTRRNLQRLDRRFLAIASQLDRIATAEKWGNDQPVVLLRTNSRMRRQGRRLALPARAKRSNRGSV